MNADHDRDRGLDQALKAMLGRAGDAPITPACLDAETLAAWMDGGLDAHSVAMAEAHASNCARCQALIGTLAHATPEVAAKSASPVRLWRWWLAPLAAGAAAVTLWMVVPNDRYSAPIQTTEFQQAAPEPPPAQARDSVAPVAPEPPAAARLQKNAPAAGKDQQDQNKLADSAARGNTTGNTAAFEESKRKAEALMKQDKPAERRDRVEPKALEERVAAAAPPPPAPPSPRSPVPSPPAPSAPVAQLGAAASRVALPSDVQITATASPSPTVSWFVGRGGVVLLTTDGKTVTRVPFPETTDLTAVVASDGQIAVVTTIDGRRFRTDDGGKTWRRSAEL